MNPSKSTIPTFRVDNSLLLRIVDKLQCDPHLRRKLDFAVNSSAYQMAGNVRFAAMQERDGRISYSLVELEQSPHLSFVMDICASGPMPFANIQARLVETFGCDAFDAERYLTELIDSQLLISDLVPAITGSVSPLEHVQQVLQCHGASGAMTNDLRVVEETICLANARRAYSLEMHGRINDVLRSMSVEPGPSPVQVDTVKEHPEIEIGRSVVDAVSQGIEFLAAMGTPRRRDLQDFVLHFQRRWGQQEIPLMTALDSEGGIGFGATDSAANSSSEIVLGLPWNASAPKREWTARDAWLLQRVQDLDCALEIVLTDADLPALLRGPPLRLPASFAAFATIMSRDEDSLERGDFRVHLKGLTGQSAARILSRFCHASDDLARLASDEAQYEATSDEAILVEFVHLPEAQNANVVLRPSLRYWELPYLGKSGAPSPQQLSIGDILVSVNNGRVQLRSQSLGRVVRIVHTSALDNAPWGMPLYRFVGAMQSQDSFPGSGWDWGCLSDAMYLPRIAYGKTVLSLRRWRLRSEQIREITDAVKGSQSRREMRVDDLVFLVERDVTLPLDLRQPNCCDLLRHHAQRREMTTLTEMLPSLELLCADDGHERFLHELVLCARSENSFKEPARHIVKKVAPNASVVQRRFAPGSEWTFFKIYGAPAALDRVVFAHLRKWSADQRVQRWFFVRYNDPHWHLRYRVRSARNHSLELIDHIASELEQLVAAQVIVDFEIAPYERELEKYTSSAGFDWVEDFFFRDSQAALEIIEREANGDSRTPRWQAGLMGVHATLDLFHVAQAERAPLMEAISAHYAEELAPSSSTLLHELGRRYRANVGVLSAALDKKGRSSADCCVAEILDARNALVLSSSSSVIASSDARALIPSFIHMHVNRIVCANPREHEFVICDFLGRYYRTYDALRKTRGNEEWA